MTIDPNVHRLHSLRVVRPDDILTAPISMGLRLGQPAVASPETTDLPWWNPLPPVPQPVRYVEPRRTIRQFMKDELPGALMVSGVLGGVAYALALGFSGAA